MSSEDSVRKAELHRAPGTWRPHRTARGSSGWRPSGQRGGGPDGQRWLLLGRKGSFLKGDYLVWLEWGEDFTHFPLLLQRSSSPGFGHRDSPASKLSWFQSPGKEAGAVVPPRPSPRHFWGQGHANGTLSVCDLSCGFQLEHWLIVLLSGPGVPWSASVRPRYRPAAGFGTESSASPLTGTVCSRCRDPRRVLANGRAVGARRVCAFSLGTCRLVPRNTVALRFQQGKINRLRSVGKGVFCFSRGAGDTFRQRCGWGREEVGVLLPRPRWRLGAAFPGNLTGAVCVRSGQWRAMPPSRRS